MESDHGPETTAIKPSKLYIVCFSLLFFGFLLWWLCIFLFCLCIYLDLKWLWAVIGCFFISIIFLVIVIYVKRRRQNLTPRTRGFAKRAIGSTLVGLAEFVGEQFWRFDDAPVYNFYLVFYFFYVVLRDCLRAYLIEIIVTSQRSRLCPLGKPSELNWCRYDKTTVSLTYGASIPY